MDRRTLTGLLLAIVSAAAFATSGVLARGLLEAGWTPVSAVSWRLTTAFLVLLVPALVELRGRWHLLRTGAPGIVAFGLLAVAACQVCYFQAVQHLSVGVALMLEYLGMVLVVGWLWLRHGQRPRRLTLAGVVLAVLGLLLVLDVLGSVQVSPVGVLWGLGAAVGLACYFVVSADERTGVPPLTMATAGIGLGALVLQLVAATGLVPAQRGDTAVQLAGATVPWIVPVLGLGLVAGALAYTVGIVAARRLGSTLASFVGLTEVLFAVVFAWLVLGELPRPVQLLGGALILAGVVAVRLDSLPPAGPPEEPAAPLPRRTRPRPVAR